MKISKNKGKNINIIEPQNSNEEKILNGTYLKTKLAYQIGNIDKDYVLVNGGKFFNYDLLNEKITIPNFLEDKNQFAYYLRTIMDSNLIKNAHLPIHGAACGQERNILFIFGDTNKGKSFALNELLPYTNPIGDDHLIVGKNEVRGNDCIRIRNGKHESIKNLIKNPISQYEEYDILWVDITKGDSIGGLTPSQIISNKKTLESILKYGLIKPFNKNDRELFKDYLINKETQEKYMKKFVSFLENAKSLRYSTGKGGIEEALKKWK